MLVFKFIIIFIRGCFAVKRGSLFFYVFSCMKCFSL
nr:MAG TPA: hypothetical protein [Caudoviricetes sp.]